MTEKEKDNFDPRDPRIKAINERIDKLRMEKKNAVTKQMRRHFARQIHLLARERSQIDTYDKEQGPTDFQHHAASAVSIDDEELEDEEIEFEDDEEELEDDEEEEE